MRHRRRCTGALLYAVRKWYAKRMRRLYLVFSLLGLGCDGKSVAEREIEADRAASQPFVEQLKKTNACPDCKIEYADLRGGKFDQANLRGAGLFMVDAPDSSFRGADFTDGFLFGNLQRADLRDIRFHDSGLSGDLRGADIRGSTFSGRTSLKPHYAQGARMDNLDLRGIALASSGNFAGAILRGADLRGLVFNGTSGSYRRREGSLASLRPGYGGMHLAGADLRDADLRGTNMNTCDLSNADLRGAKLQGAEFSGANLQGAKLSLDQLADAHFGAATWIDGTTCAVESSGKCVPTVPKASAPEGPNVAP